MAEPGTWRKAWLLLDAREKRYAFITFVVVIIAATSSAFMVGSVVPFLSVLAEPSRVETNPSLREIYHYLELNSAYDFLLILAVASFAMILLASLIQIAKIYIVLRFSMTRMHSFSHKLMQHYLRQPYEFFLDRHSGELGTRILSESREVVLQFLRPATDLIASLATVIAIASLLLWIEPVVASAAFAVLGFLYGLTYAITRRYLKRLGKDRVAANSMRFRTATEAFGGVKVIKLLCREQEYLTRYASFSRRMACVEVLVNTIASVPLYALQAFALGGMMLICILMLDTDAYGKQNAVESILPLLGVIAFAGQRLMPELSVIYHSLSKLQAGRAAVDVVYDDLVATENEYRLQSSTQTLALRQSLQLRNISYRYPSAETLGLDDINLTIQAGERLGIVGTSGAGKTTLADIILGLLRPHNGEFVADGTPITDENVRSWMQDVGYVPQDVFLTDSSIAENIALGIDPKHINLDKVQDAARIAQLDEFILHDLPNGYDTLVGERGVRLSGGQIQRIGIARALYNNPDLIVFDEATSALDNVTEQEVMAAIDALPGGKTIILIAHRLSTVKRCDRIALLDKGKLVDCNSWDLLMETSPIFQKIAMSGQLET